MWRPAGLAGPVTSVVILGGGTAGWMTAAALLQRLGPLGINVTLVESSQIGTIGVGEATVPAILRFFDSLDLDVYEVLRATNGTIKLGIEFDGWKHEGHSFIHPFSQYGIHVGPVGFHHLWNRLRAAGETSPLDDYSLGVQMARAGRVFLPTKQPRADFEIFDWAIHFDASRFAQFLRRYCEARGVRRIDARLMEAVREPQNGHIARLRLDNGETVEGQLFIDCSGFHRLLIERVFDSGFEDWRHWLMCDRAVALPCVAAEPTSPAPYTRSRAMKAGWTWRIPLQNRIGNGYVYSSDHISDDAAVASLRHGLEGKALAEPNFVRFRAGHMRRFWAGNCVAIGLSAGFLEPLESTSISLIQMGIDKLIHLWPDTRMAPELAAEYNRLSVQEFARIRDFIILHYAANGRTDGDLWRHCREMTLPDTLEHKIALYRTSGRLVQYPSESFFESSWVCMYANFGIEARGWEPLTELLDLDELKTVTRRLRPDIAALAREGSPHREFLRLHGALADT
jgi:tryptophan 7-halogenase